MNSELFFTKAHLLSSQSVFLEVVQVSYAVVCHAHLTHSVTIQTIVTSAHAQAALTMERRFVALMESPTKTRVNSRNIPARKTSTLKLYHRVDVRVRLKKRLN